MFHEVVNEEIKNYSPYVITVNEFEKYLTSIATDKLISIEELFKCISEKEKHEKNVITFDDVHDSVYYNAVPFLKKNKIPFTLFVSLSLLDKHGYLSIKQLIELSKEPLCTIGSHGIDHIYYRFLSKKDCEKQLNDSKQKLEKIINKKVEYFAFPYGSFFACSFENIKLAKRSSYKLAFSTIPEKIKNSFIFEKFFLPRICVTSKYIKMELEKI